MDDVRTAQIWKDYFPRKRRLRKTALAPMLVAYPTDSDPNPSVDGFLVTEKLDGVRMLYNPVCRQFTSRTKRVYDTAWTEEVPAVTLPNGYTHLDGELVVDLPDRSWKDMNVILNMLHRGDLWDDHVRYYVFDAIHPTQPAEKRYRVAKAAADKTGIPFMAVPMRRGKGMIRDELKRFPPPSEGVVARHPASLYRFGGRSSYDLLKVKNEV